MKKLIKLTLIAFIAVISLYANDSLQKSVKTISDAPENMTKKVEENINEVLNSNTYRFLSGNGIHDRDSCKIECPPLKEDYFGRIANFSLRTGSTQCYVYKKGSNNLLGTATNKNGHCTELFSPQVVELKNKYKNSNILKTIKDYEKVYFENYADTGNDKFINASKYMIAGLTIDSAIVDISKTLQTNEMKVNPEYTIYPNAQVESSQGFLKDFFNDLKEFFGSASSIEANYKLVSSVKSFMSSSILFIMRFLAEFDEIMLLAKSFTLFTILPFTIIFAVSSKITKFISGVSDYEDITEKILVGIITVFVFYFSTTKIKVDEELEISQTNFQNWFRPVMYKGVEIADQASEAVAKAFIKHKLSNAGYKSHEEIKSLLSNEVLKWSVRDVM